MPSDLVFVLGTHRQTDGRTRPTARASEYLTPLRNDPAAAGVALFASAGNIRQTNSCKPAHAMPTPSPRREIHTYLHI